MYRSTSDSTNNMEYLWSMSNAETGEGDPLANSLFNLTTLQTLVDLGNSPNTTNMLYEKDKTYGVDFNLDDDKGWTNLANTL